MKKNIRVALATASCALVQPMAVQAEDEHTIGDWDIGAALLFYNEPDRVQAIEPVVTARKHIDTDEWLNLKLTVDSLTGSSGSGAVPTSRPQTFTNPSGDGRYTIGANETPLDDTFLDTRVALNASWEKPIAADTTMVLGGNVSKEYDYFSVALSSTFARDFRAGNTTVLAGLAAEFDQADPVGGVPIPFGEMAEQDGAQPRGASSDDKIVIDAVLGVTQIIDENSLFQLNYSVSQSDGYLTDPYKIISVVDATTGIPLFRNANSPDLPVAVFENRPDTRLKHSLYGQYKRFLSGDVMDISYRFMTDDWGIDSHTIDARYRWKLSDSTHLTPHIRVYQQSAADFYQRFYISGDQPTAGDANAYGTSDYRLGEFTAYTIGLEYGMELARSSWSVAVEYYLQSGDEPAGKFGELLNQELYPDVDAMMLRLIYDF
ncbi:MAG: DUF3570 domain-containing protein [Pseudomonadales bacterium]